MNALALVLALSALGSVDVEARLRDAHQLAARRETSAAIDVYRALLADGVDGADLRYNLGTLWLESGDVGRAVKELLAARRFAPLDDDVAHNLSIAIESRTDRLAGEGGADPLWLIGARTPPGAARLALALPLALLGLLLALGAFVASRALRIATLACGVLSVAGLSLWLCRVEFERTGEAVVVAAQAPALKEPDAAAAESFIAHAGLSGIVVDDQGAWVRLRMENGLEAWLQRDALGFVGEQATSGPP